MSVTIIGVSGTSGRGRTPPTCSWKLLLDEDETGRVRKFAFADALKKMAREEFSWDGVKDERGRKLLQELGVALRHIEEGFWVNKTIEAIREQGGSLALGSPNQVFCITDCRFPNEADAIRKMGGVVWRIERPGLPHTDTHISETALDDYPEFDHRIIARSLDELLQGVKDGLRRMGLYTEDDA